MCEPEWNFLENSIRQDEHVLPTPDSASRLYLSCADLLITTAWEKLAIYCAEEWKGPGELWNFQESPPPSSRNSRLQLTSRKTKMTGCLYR